MMGIKKTVKIWECDNCGNVGKWSKGWQSKTKYHKTWDELIVACCDKCAEALDKRKGRRQNK